MKKFMRCMAVNPTYVELIGEGGVDGCHIDVPDTSEFEVGKEYAVIVVEVEGEHGVEED